MQINKCKLIYIHGRIYYICKLTYKMVPESFFFASLRLRYYKFLILHLYAMMEFLVGLLTEA